LFVAALFLLLCQWPSSAAGDQDPPGRVARISYIQGSVSFRPSGQTDWFEASTNRPMTTGDSLWVDKNSRGEIHIDSTAIRLSGETGLSMLNIDDRTVQLQLFTGSVEVHLRHSLDGDAFEIDTPNLALTLTAGEFRIEADPSGAETSIAVRRGAAEVTAGGESYGLRDAQVYTFTGSDTLTYAATPLPLADDFENWCQSREQKENDSPSAHYVSRDIDGYYDLDDSGDWESDSEYGPVWFPRALPVGWAPYHFGHWVFIAPWGWTWVGEESWGFAPFHYGRWTYTNGRWGWVPGPVVIRPVYAPAMVAFVNVRGLGLSSAVGSSPGVAWFPLGPRDVYVPGYHTSLRYVQNLNVTNTKLITSETVANVYNNDQDHAKDHKTSGMTYANRQAPGAVTAVSHDTFVAARPVAVSALHVPPQQLRSAPVVGSAAVAPTRSSYVSASAKPTTARPYRSPPSQGFPRPLLPIAEWAPYIRTTAQFSITNVLRKLPTPSCPAPERMRKRRLRRMRPGRVCPLATTTKAQHLAPVARWRSGAQTTRQPSRRRVTREHRSSSPWRPCDSPLRSKRLRKCTTFTPARQGDSRRPRPSHVHRHLRRLAQLRPAASRKRSNFQFGETGFRSRFEALRLEIRRQSG